MSHTPAPWNICWGTYNGQRMNFHITASPHGSVRPIAETRWKSDWSETESQEIEANAHLIAAAPDLLEAAKQAEKELLWASDQFEGGEVLRIAAQNVRAAIAKAKGETQ